MAPSRKAVVGALVAFVLVTAEVFAQEAARITASVSAITAGANNLQRREAIVKLLAEGGVMVERQAFGEGDRAGVNLVVTLPGREARTILVGAHYDRVSVGQGAVDNAASCAALIELIGAFKASPLGRYTLKFVFFDQEELGLLGSRAYLQSPSDLPAFAINVDVFAYGDTLFVTSRQTEGILARAVQAAADAHRIPVTMVPPDRYPGSDHISMIAAGIETIGVALVDKADVDGILAASPTKLVPGKGPRILTIIHTAGDTTAEVKADQMERAIPVLEQTIRIVERQ
jgi:Zn-dependent M28 family amino/carboxypeptidase